MKKYILYLLTGMAACGFCGCEDQLDRYPKDKLTPDKFFRNEQECQLYTNDFYTIFPTTVLRRVGRRHRQERADERGAGQPYRACHGEHLEMGKAA